MNSSRKFFGDARHDHCFKTRFGKEKGVTGASVGEEKSFRHLIISVAATPFGLFSFRTKMSVQWKIQPEIGHLFRITDTSLEFFQLLESRLDYIARRDLN